MWLQLYKKWELAFSSELKPSSCKCLCLLRLMMNEDCSIDIKQRDLCQQLHMARQTLWKALNELNSYGIISFVNERSSTKTIRNLKFNNPRDWSVKVLFHFIEVEDHAGQNYSKHIYVYQEAEKFLLEKYNGSALKVLMCMRGLSVDRIVTNKIVEISEITGISREKVGKIVKDLKEKNVIRSVHMASKRRDVYELTKEYGIG